MIHRLGAGSPRGCQEWSPFLCRSPSPVVQHTGFMDQLSVKPLRRTRSARSASPAVHRSVHITADHGVLIKKTWQRVPKNQFGETLIQDLANRIGRESFGPDPTSYERHARHFVDLIQSAVDNLADLEEVLKPWLTVLGRGHVGFRIKSKHWDSFGESVLATVSIYIGPGGSTRRLLGPGCCFPPSWQTVSAQLVVLPTCPRW
ncbi:unnamed protein product, partial [Mesorhabditis spiculigera]